MLFTVEGIDGAGKGTLTKGLVALAEMAGYRVATLSFPRYGENRFARLVAQYLNGHFGKIDDVPAEFAALLYAGDRHESREKLLGLLADSDLVILDRYVASNIAYGAAKLPADERQRLIDWIREVEYEIFELPRPQLTCLIATAPATAQDLVGRKDNREYTDDSHDMHEENQDYLSRVAAVYRELAARQLDASWFVVDPGMGDGGLRSPEDLQREAWRRIEAELAKA